MKIIYSAYYCNPFGGSESYGAINWLNILLKEFDIVLITNKPSEEGLRLHFGSRFPSNLVIYSFADENILKRKFKVQVHFGYFTFNHHLRRFIQSNKEVLADAKVVLHKNPSSFRYFTYWYQMDLPLILGPLGGGLQVPTVLKKYFTSEPLINKFRKYDKLLFKLPLYKKLYGRVDKILISFDYILNTLPRKYHSKCETFFDTGIEVDIDFYDRSYRQDQVVKIVYVGKLIRYKGAELAIRALHKIKDRNIRFDILGDGGEYGYLKRLIEELNVSDKVTLHGNLSREQVNAYYREADIFCFPTLTEAGGTVFLEAMKFGLPIVTINNGGPKYLCPDEGTFKIEIDKPETMVKGIAEKLDLLIDSKELRHAMGEANYWHCKKNYSWEVTRDKIIDLFAPYK
ncbi:MAG: glycosyltransferase family 4 protein [Cyclobacteriaceae bacterium]|nr:glycosyltransferase family 4 protein [Cyclobacteriaceae bacterium]